MIRSVTVRDFKSYKAATLPLAELTVLIGANASGKSNLIEALQLLSWIAGGRRLSDLISAVKERELVIRGTTPNLTFGGGGVFGFDCVVADDKTEEEKLRLELTLRLDDHGLHIFKEELWALDERRTNLPLYEVEGPAGPYSSEIQIAYNNFARGRVKPHIAGIDQQAVFTQLTTPARFDKDHEKSQAVIPASTEQLRRSLEAVLFLDPVPVKMREYAFIVDKKLRGDGSNVSAVLFDLCNQPGRKQEVLEFVRSLPEQDIADIEFLKGPRNEVMVQLQETFGKRVAWWEAASLSDGTLRVLAVASALLSVPEGSLVVIEEIDNGVHPSRAKALLAGIQKLASARKLRVLLTTHNPALLDAIPLSAVPNIVACYRDPEHGDSKLVRLEDLEKYPELVAQGGVGQLVTQGTMERFLKARIVPDDREQQAQRFLDFLSERPPTP